MKWEKIQPLDAAAMARTQAQWNTVAKPLNILGRFERLVIQMAGITGSANVQASPACVLVCCADNGVVAQGVSQTDQSVTRAVAENLARRTTSVCRMAATAHCDVVPVDIGMAGEKVRGVLDRRIAAGTADFTQGPAMTRAQTIGAIEAREGFEREGLYPAGDG